ncbi:hypothetical protein ACSFA7_33450 [Variovorax sp. LT1R20]|uniref:hypothetical protein n=1 Tax=Variovorax sp. LT1R20 TaxID=3443729 RepID=UPI003F479125
MGTISQEQTFTASFQFFLAIAIAALQGWLNASEAMIINAQEANLRSSFWGGIPSVSTSRANAK